MKKPTRILIVEDVATDADLAKRAIRNAVNHCEFQVVETRGDFLSSLETYQPDVILADYTLPRFDGMNALKLTLKHAPLTPLIIWTGSTSEDVAVDCMKAGANNYVLKDNLKRLGPAVIHALEERQLLLQRSQAEEKYQAIFENSVIGVFQSTPDGRFINVNAAMARIYGYDSPQAMIQEIKNISDQIYVDSGKRVEFTARLHSQNTVENYEQRNFRRDGGVIWTSTSARVVREPDGNVLYYEGFITDITARKQTEQSLQERERQLTILFSNLPGPVYRCLNDDDHTMEFISDSIMDLSGYESEDFRQHRRHFGKMIHPDDKERVWMEIQAAMEKNEPFELTYRIIKATGEEKWVWDKGQGIRNAEGQLQALEGFITDITERKMVEERLKESETKYRTLIEHLPAITYISELDQYVGVSYISPQIESLGFNQDEWLADPELWFRQIDPEDQERVSDELQKFQDGGPAFRSEYRLLRQDGETRWLHDESIYVRDQEGRPILKQGFMIDITEQKQAEDALRQSQVKYRHLVETSHDLIWSIDAEGRFTFVNRAAQEIYGYEPEDLIGRSFFELLDPEYYRPEDLEKFKETLAHTDELREVESYIRHRDGRQLILSANSLVLRDAEGRRLGVTGHSRDITARKQVENMLKAERNLLRTLIDNLPDRIYAMDAQGRKTLSNTADWKASGGKAMEDVIGKTDYDMYPPELAEGFWQLNQSVLESGRPVINHEEPGLDEDGNRVSILTTKIPLRDEEGNVFGLVGIGRDITEHKQAEARINDLLAFNEKILNYSPLGMFTYKLTGECVFANENAARMVGASVEQLRTQNFHAIESWKKSGLYELVEKAIETHTAVTADIHHLSTFGKDVWLTAHCVTFSSKDEEHVLLSIADTTDRKLAEVRLRQSENRYRLAIQATNDVIWEWNAKTNQLLWSENARHVFGYLTEEIGPEAGWWDDHIHPDDRTHVQSKLNALIAGRESLWLEEYRFRVKGGSYAYISDRGYIERDENGAALRMIGAMSDITHRKESEVERQALLEIMQGLANTNDLPELLKLIHHSIAKVIYAENFFVVLYRPGTGLFEEIYSADQYDLPEPPSTLEKSITSYVFHSGEPLLLTRARFAELIAQGEVKLVGTDSKSWLGVPLKTSGKTIGVMAVQDYESENRYSERDKDFLMSTAAQVALVIERKQAEEALRESEQHHRVIFEGVQDAIFVESIDGRILMVNERACEMFGYSRAEFLTKTVPDLVPEGSPILMASGTDALLSSEPRETLNLRANGEVFPIEISGRILVINGELVLLVVVRDITERKQAEAELRRSHSLLYATLESTADGILVVEPDGRISNFNQKFLELWHIPDRLAARRDDRVLLDYVLNQLKDPASFVSKVRFLYQSPEATSCDELEFCDGRIFERFSQPQRLGNDIVGRVWSFRDITERKRAEDELRFEKERFETIAATVPGIICSFRLQPDGSACMPFASTALQEVCGFLPKELEQDAAAFFARIHPDDLPQNFAQIAESARSMLPCHNEFRYHHPTKGEVWLEAQSMPVQEPDGSIIWHGFISDITERKWAEAELRASEERFRQLANNIQEVFWMTDAGTNQVLYMSPAAEQIWGRPIDALMREPGAFTNSVFPEDQPAVLRAIEKEKQGEKLEIEYRIVRPNGTLRWVWDRAFPIFDDSGRVKRIAGLSADITERRESELALIKSQSRYRELFDSSPISIWEEDFSLVKQRIDSLLQSGVTSLPDYLSGHPEEAASLASLVRVMDVNQAALDLYCVEEKESLLKGLTQIVSPDALSHFQEEVLGFISPSKSFRWEGTDKMLNGKQMEVIVTGSIPHGYEEDWSKVIVSVSDITERKRAEEELFRRAEETSALLKTSLALTDLDLKAILQTISNSAKNLFAADGCRVFLMEPDGKSLRCVLALQENAVAFSDLIITIGQGVTGAVAASGKAEIVNAMQNDPRSVQVSGTPEEEEAIMFAPLRERDHTIGVLSIRHTGTERPFQPADLELLEAFASMAASAVSNARLFEETQRRLAELEALYENGLAVGRLLKPAEIGSRIIDTFAHHLRWHHVTIRLRKDDSDDLELVAFNVPNLKEEDRSRVEQGFMERVSKVGQGLSGWAIQIGLPIRTGDVHAHPQYIDMHAGIQSGLYMPLRAGERVIGVISVESQTPNAFTEQDERLLATLASQAAIAFENARLYQAIEQELSERNRAEEALRLSETHYRELADSITDILFELDQNLRYTHWNKASELLTSIPVQEAIGKSMHEIFGESEQQNKIGRIYEEVLVNRQPRTFETILIVNGEKRYFDINAYPSTRGVSVVAKDVTDRKRSETIMQKRFELMEYSTKHTLNELMQQTVDEVSELTGSSIGFFHFVEADQTNLGMKTWSTNALRLFNVPVTEGTHLPLDQAGVWAEAVRQRRPLIQNDYESLAEKKRLPRGHVPVVREIVIPILRNERIVSVMGIGNKPHDYTPYDLEIAERLADYAWDITERKKMEDALAEERNQLARRVEERTADLSRANSNLARALRVKDEFLANMSHELRTPLNAILGLSESLAEQIAGPLNEKQQKYITTISESGHHLLSLINDILDLAKIEAGQITLDINKVDIHSVCQASLRMIKQLAQKKNQEVILDIEDKLGLMWADERRLKQMIVNLLGNAVKFTPENGKIGLEVRGDKDANKITITVWDNGIGISEDDIARLFQPFIQLDSGLARETTGTGLGLALVAQMARLHGGSVNAVSEPGNGSRFSIILPWEPALMLDTAARLRSTGKFPAIKSDESRRPTILLVEDTKEVIMMLRDYLELAGYTIVTAQDGMDAIVQARLAHPDLILMDVQMPRMNGLEATRRLRSEPDFRYTPIIALTALAMPNDRERCLAAGMDEYISKPINLKALVKIIQDCLFHNEEPESR